MRSWAAFAIHKAIHRLKLWIDIVSKSFGILGIDEAARVRRGDHWPLIIVSCELSEANSGDRLSGSLPAPPSE
jgi:hypothetical protein